MNPAKLAILCTTLTCIGITIGFMIPSDWWAFVVGLWVGLAIVAIGVVIR